MANRNRGYSLTELVVVLVLVGIVAAMAGPNIVTPMIAFIDQTRRSELTDAAALALTRMSRDIHGALPNSIRVTGGGTALELLSVVDAERYRTDPPGSDALRLQFTGPDDSFNTLGQLGSSGSTTSHYLAVYPLGQSGADPYTSSVMTPAGTTITVAASGAAVPPGTGLEYLVTLSPSHQFAFQSPAQRIYRVSGATSYICESGKLRRYEGYTFGATQPATEAATGVTGALVVDQVASCSFSYQTSGQRRALVTLLLVLESSGERVRLLRQVHVDNTP